MTAMATRGRWTGVRRLPAGPLLSMIDRSGGPTALGVQRGGREAQAISRAREEGTVTELAADLLAVHVLRVTPWEVWGAAYDAP